MPDTYKHSYKMGENFLNSLAVYNVGYQKCEPDYQWGPGIRDHYCIHHILSGSGTYTTGKISVRLKAGDTFILFPGVELEYQADSEEPWEYGWAGFMGADAASIIRNTEFSRESPYILKGRVPGEKIREGIGNIYRAKGNNYESAVAMAGALYSLLAVFMQYAEKEDRQTDTQETYVERAQSYIGNNYSYPITVEDVAAYVGISRSHLFRSFQSYLRQSPKEYLTEYRIKQACRLLRETGLSVSAIAYSVGFENNLYFSKAFRKQKGISPSEYRKAKRRSV
ncbi:AraC family transcriptional regulator [Ruminococcus sp. CLA-AA-H200]|uniref:AraC family transcriptional regulator n=1 Tax=Ruminococcus turbiniformis TaxID=2881258 RepID=A0ABS8FUR0_9FIRM|nr:AraC family transcriptional regulator [Ruminococcus turbiniformis]MCC2253797.1 AraC family transcriptional regulator [Ruminococcus turbiniformis]